MYRFLCLALLLCTTSCFELKGVKSHYPLKNLGESTELTVLTFNILSTQDLGALTRGYPSWWSRRKAVFSVLDDQNPDLASIQECSATQFEELRDRFADRYFVLHKMALTTDSIILVKRDRFSILEKGFWSLEPPLHPKIRRVAVWAKLRENASGRELMFVGVHLDARSIKRDEILFLKSELAGEHASGAPLILAGDFNSDPTEDLYYPLIVADGWKDSYSEDLGEELKTFPLKHPTRRVDYIFYYGKDIRSTHWERVDNKGFALSDHYPVLSKFFIEKAEP